VCTNRASEERERAASTPRSQGAHVPELARQEADANQVQDAAARDTGRQVVVVGLRVGEVPIGLEAGERAADTKAGEASPRATARAGRSPERAERGRHGRHRHDLEPPGADPARDRYAHARGRVRRREAPEVDTASAGRGRRTGHVHPVPYRVATPRIARTDPETHDARVGADRVEDRVRQTGTRFAHTRGAGVAAGTTVGSVRPRVDLAAVGVVAVAVGEARGASDAAGAGCAGREGVAARRADGPAGPAVCDARSRVDLAAVRRHTVAVGEARCAGAETADTCRAGRRGIDEPRTGAGASAAVRGARLGVDTDAGAARLTRGTGDVGDGRDVDHVRTHRDIRPVRLDVRRGRHIDDDRDVDRRGDVDDVRAHRDIRPVRLNVGGHGHIDRRTHIRVGQVDDHHDVDQRNVRHVGGVRRVEHVRVTVGRVGPDLARDVAGRRHVEPIGRQSSVSSISRVARGAVDDGAIEVEVADGVACLVHDCTPGHERDRARNQPSRHHLHHREPPGASAGFEPSEPTKTFEYAERPDREV
jgi:hypothetical protein